VLAALVAGCVAVGASGCVDDAAAAAAAAAIELDGTWIGDDGSALELATEGPLSNVRCVWRRAPLDAAEQDLVDRLPDPSVVTPSLTLGAGPDPLLDELVGGESVVIDDRVQLQVRAPALVDRDGTTRRWQLQLEGDAAALSGALVITTLTRVERPGDLDGGFAEATRTVVPARFSR
jgi:hypothetical protein